MAIKPVKVSQLNSYIKRILQTDPLLGNVSVVGEISNLKYHSSGHVYFTMKDDTSKLNCFLPQEVFEQLHYELSDGMEITAIGYIYLYERGGSYSLNVRDIVIEGIGNLSIAFEKLKEKLAKEGLFDEKYKKEIPYFPKKIAVITSETGAALRDILKIIKNRNNVVDVLVYPCLVQGPAAAGEISRAIGEVNQRFPEVDTLIVGRGGGSLEELWAFNEEIVARSIFDSMIPVISAVGHETDFTISDFVADRRAETPTAAAAIAAPDLHALKEYIHMMREQLMNHAKSRVTYLKMRLDINHLDGLKASVIHKLERHQMYVNNRYMGLFTDAEKKVESLERRIENHKIRLESMSPQGIMKQGYVAVTDQRGVLIRSVSQLHPGEIITTVYADGKAACRIEEIRRNQNGS